MSQVVVLVSAGLLQPKKVDHAFARKHRYLNYGLLTLGTILHENGQQVRMFHGGFASPGEFAEALVANNTIDGGRPLLLSLPSHLSITWAQRFLSQVKRLCRAARVIVGGRWVLGGVPRGFEQNSPKSTSLFTGQRRIECWISEFSSVDSDSRDRSWTHTRAV
jgi:hypothetical protein